MKQLKGSIKIGALPEVMVPGRKAGQMARYGVGEVITLVPQQNLPLNQGAGTWAIKSGHGKLTNIGNGRAKFTADDLSMTEFSKNLREYTVILELRNPKGVLAEVSLNIVAPDQCGLLKLGPRHVQGSSNSGFWGQLCIGPNDVSFMNIELKESRGTINADGVHAFERGTIHQETTDWLPMLKVTIQGTLANANDRVWSPAQEPNGGWRSHDNSIAGNFVWDIAWMYKLASDPADAKGLQFGKAWHKATTKFNGRMKVEKGGAEHIADINDPTVNFTDVCPLPLL